MGGELSIKAVQVKDVTVTREEALIIFELVETHRTLEYPLSHLSPLISRTLELSFVVVKREL